jgi:hypothetical protein
MAEEPTREFEILDMYVGHDASVSTRLEWVIPCEDGSEGRILM